VAVLYNGQSTQGKIIANKDFKDQRGFELIDIREQEDFSADHIEGARHIPLANLFSDSSLASLSSGHTGEVGNLVNGKGHGGFVV
jgi:rhodanese-related sulfurtransferase